MDDKEWNDNTSALSTSALRRLASFLAISLERISAAISLRLSATAQAALFSVWTFFNSTLKA